ncbi:DJ-1/PfpI family protein [Metamycoplasma hyosynoviae]|uniref:DJ-1/PfpI family protein n=1 Tax=Metamycoplasma hyosynoviae TaxID=29559 RepID=UPI0023588309|nr:DJ-1/PfpI family protein [Metamycoplasma hyosynoviae]MDC8901098.1 DJ-1/PfpI family protein [Metamycoplasma hyosynoviae]MDC8912545.1 DJ-1/PfpI family protein [Metamycoplasma hyosynoviae]MDC8913108.1 DJ-1/PfpI family protein [Metamycoplasma hyosynoviae]MDC8914401.1 DJ-1/PfpI family protein [Metamycoplasma hyosynoviae]MDC8915170.1 DJ-1/PfpI family protein [Metamycoplasma hyosynoviae]
MKILVLVHNHFNDIELGTTLAILSKWPSISKITIYNPDSTIKQVVGQCNVLKLDVEHTFNFDEYDAIFIPGGKGAQTLRKDTKSIEIIKKFRANKQKYIFAICDAPNVLYENKIIDDNVSYSSYPIDTPFLFGAKRTETLATVDGNIVTGRSPYATFEFAFKILETLFKNNLEEVAKYKKAFKGE